MTSPTTDRRQGLVGNTAIKAPVACATTADTVLSGEQVIDGVQTAASRVLVWRQADPTENGIYDTSSASWTRSLDADGNYDLAQGTLVTVNAGSQAPGFFRLLSADPITVGSSAQFFAPATPSSATVPRLVTATSSVDPSGTTDSTAALQAIFAGGGWIYFPAGIYKISAALLPTNDTRITLEAGATITTSTVDINVIDCTGKSKVQIYGAGKLQMTGTGTAGNIGVINFDGSSDCLAFGVEIAGNQWAGVRMNNAVNTHAVLCKIHDSLGSVNDAAGVVVYRNCIDCSVDSCEITNPGHSGVLVQGPGQGTFPLRTKVTRNVIDGCTSYGVISYQIDAANTDTLIEGNTIKNVSGSALGGSAGAGVYIQNAGGNHAIGNRIRNVCTLSSNNTLTPAGIGVNNIGTVTTTYTAAIAGTTMTVSGGSPASSVLIGATVTGAGVAAGTVVMAQISGQASDGTYTVNISQTVAATAMTGTLVLVPPVIDTNTIVDVGFDASGVANPNALTLAGINISSSSSGATLGPNAVTLTRNGLPSATWIGLWINASSNVTGQVPNCAISNGQSGSLGVFVYANGSNISNIALSGGSIAGCDGAQVRVDQSGTHTVAGFTLSGSTLSGGSANCESLKLASIVGGAITGVSASANTAAALDITACTSLSVTGGSLASSGATTAKTAGTCTGSFIGESVVVNGVIDNAGTGLLARFYADAIPGSGHAAVGDTLIRRTPAANSWDYQRCTTAGTNGGTAVWKQGAAIAA